MSRKSLRHGMEPLVLCLLRYDVRETPSDFGSTSAEWEAVVLAAPQSGTQILTVAQARDAIQAA